MKSTSIFLVLAGAVIGGLLGHFIFAWIVGQGLYALILPGAAVGLGAGIFKNKSKAVAVLCGLLALALGLFTEWRFFPFAKDDSLGYFLFHIHELKPITLIMIAVGALIGFWIPFGHTRQMNKQNAS